MAISALGYAAERIEERDADIFIGIGSFANPVVAPDDLLYLMGAVRNVTVNGEVRETSADSHGQTYQRGVDLTITWEVMQTGYAIEFKEIAALINQRVMIKVTDTLVEYATGADVVATQANASTAAHAAEGIEFENAKVLMGFGLNFGGEDSVITLTTKARLSNTQIGQLGQTPIVLGV